QPASVAQARQLLRRLSREVVPDPPSIRLRRDDVARKVLLIAGKRPDARPENVAKAELLLVVVPQPATAMQVHDERQLPGSRRPEKTIGHRPITLVRARLELLVNPFGLLLER